MSHTQYRPSDILIWDEIIFRAATEKRKNVLEIPADYFICYLLNATFSIIKILHIRRSQKKYLISDKNFLIVFFLCECENFRTCSRTHKHTRRKLASARVWHTNTQPNERRWSWMTCIFVSDNFRSDFNLHNVDVGHLWATVCVHLCQYLIRLSLWLCSWCFSPKNEIIYCVYDVRNDFLFFLAIKWFISDFFCFFLCFLKIWCGEEKF